MTMSMIQVGLILIRTFFLLLALSVPVPTSLVVSFVLTTTCVMDSDLATFMASQKMITGVDSFSLIAVPFFILCSVLMNSGGIAQELISFAKLFMGFIPDDLAHTNILGSTLFGFISDSFVTASIAVGDVMVPPEEKEGYDHKFAATASIASAPTESIIPPSRVLIVYVVLSGCSVVGMIMSGYIPGFMWYIACMMVAFATVKKSKYPTTRAVPAKVFIHMFINAVPGLLLIVIIVGGVCSGIFTATESAAVAVAYTLFLSIVRYRTIKIKDLPATLYDTCETTAVIMSFIVASSAMSFVVFFTRLSATIGRAMLSISSNPYVVFLVINIIFLIVGTFTNIAPAVLIFVPIFLLIVKSFGMHPIHFGIMIIVNLGIGNITPPVRSALFPGCSVAGTDMGDIIKPILSFYGAIFAVLMLVVYVPRFSIVIPTLIGAV